MITKELIARKFSYRGYVILGTGVYYVTNDDPDNFESRYVCEMRGDLAETFGALEDAGWPNHEGEIPCVNCGDLINELGSLCPRCGAAGA